jgi:hypothetical protein
MPAASRRRSHHPNGSAGRCRHQPAGRQALRHIKKYLYSAVHSLMQTAVRRSFLHQKEKTMKLRVILVCTLLLLAASPSFALPVCAECIVQTNSCDEIPGSIERCKYNFTTGLCFTTTERCSSPSSASTVLTDWKVAAVEINRPAQECDTVPAPATKTEAPAPALQAPQLK